MKKEDITNTKPGVYETICGNDCEYENGYTAYNLDSGKTIPVKKVVSRINSLLFKTRWEMKKEVL